MSYKVYYIFPDGSCSTDTGAVLRAFQQSISIGREVIVAEMQVLESYYGPIATAADNAFDSGRVVIAANGNFGPAAQTVRSPAIARKVIGVGDFDAYSFTTIDGESRGPAPDGRIKPDIQAPTDTLSAANDSDTAVRVFAGTSGATPYAGGVAALFYAYARGCLECPAADAGNTYAFLILSGQQPYPFDNTVGAGRLRMPDLRGQVWWGKVSVANGQTIDIPLDVNTDVRNIFDAALWWPESQGQSHNNLNLSIVDPYGSELAVSTDSLSVFQRARVNQSLTAGTWKVRVRGNSVPAGPQTVYWAAMTSKQTWLQ